MFADSGQSVPMDPFERWLADGLAIEPPAAALERIDRRVRAVLAGPVPIDHRRRFGRRTVLVILLAAALAAMGAGAGLLGLYDTIFGPVQGWRLAYDRAEPLAMDVTSGDVRATLDRGYADANEVAVFVSAVNISDSAQPTFDIGYSLVDGDGREYQGTFAGGAPDNAFAAAMLVFDTPEPWLSGTRHFTLTIPSFSDPRAMATDPSPDAGRITGGPFVYQFELTTQGGQVAVAGPPSTAAGQTVTLRQLVVSAAAIRGVFVIEPKPADQPLRRQVRVQLGSRSFTIGPQDEEAEGDKLLFTFWTVEGSDNPPSSGSVEVTGLGPDAAPMPGERWSLPFVLPDIGRSPG